MGAPLQREDVDLNIFGVREHIQWKVDLVLIYHSNYISFIFRINIGFIKSKRPVPGLGRI